MSHDLFNWKKKHPVVYFDLLKPAKKKSRVTFFLFL
jgi:hypothetical protein